MEDRREHQKEVKQKFAENFIEDSTLPVYLNYNAVHKYKSIRRAIKRGHVDLYTGMVFPDRPFNNRKNRKYNELKKRIYGQYKERAV